MKYQSLFQEANNGVEERCELVIERLECILEENSVADKYRAYFRETTAFLLYLMNRIESKCGLQRKSH